MARQQIADCSPVENQLFPETPQNGRRQGAVVSDQPHPFINPQENLINAIGFHGNILIRSCCAVHDYDRIGKKK
jgi:hypothetical protein